MFSFYCCILSRSGLRKLAHLIWLCCILLSSILSTTVFVSWIHYVIERTFCRPYFLIFVSTLYWLIDSFIHWLADWLIDWLVRFFCFCFLYQYHLHLHHYYYPQFVAVPISIVVVALVFLGFLQNLHGSFLLSAYSFHITDYSKSGHKLYQQKCFLIDK